MPETVTVPSLDWVRLATQHKQIKSYGAFFHRHFRGATTFSIMTLSIMTLSIMTFSITALRMKGFHVTPSIDETKHERLCITTLCTYAECHFIYLVMLNVVMLHVVMLSVVILNVVMLNVVKLNVAFYLLLC